MTGDQLHRQSASRFDHWFCESCGTFDGPMSGDDCDVCWEREVYASVTHVVPRSEAERLAEALWQGIPHMDAPSLTHDFVVDTLAEYRSRHPKETP